VMALMPDRDGRGRAKDQRSYEGLQVGWRRAQLCIDPGPLGASWPRPFVGTCALVRAVAVPSRALPAVIVVVHRANNAHRAPLRGRSLQWHCNL
jgi:hypothetical protein